MREKEGMTEINMPKTKPTVNVQNKNIASWRYSEIQNKYTKYIMELFNKRTSKHSDDFEIPVRICSPMVRYSKLPFRMLVRLYDCDIAYTPMIMADSFSSSALARDNEFTTNSEDRPLIVQFAANKVDDFVRYVIGDHR